MDLLLALLVGACVAAVSWAVLDLLFAEERGVTRRLQTLTESERREAGEVEPLSTPFRQRVLGPAGHSMVAMARRVAPRDYLRRLDERCVMAGRPANATGDLILVFQMFAAIGLAVGGGMIAATLWDSSAATLAAAFIGLMAGWLLPSIWLSGKVDRRK